MILAFVLLSQQSKSQNNVEYLDYENLKENLTSKVEMLIASKKVVGINGLKTQAKSVKESQTVNVVLPLSKTIELNSEQIYEQNKNGAALIGRYAAQAEGEKRKSEFMASAIILTEDGVCASNYHVFAEIVTGGVFGNYDRKNTDSLRFIGTADGKVYAIESLLSYNQQADIAIFKVNTNGDRLTAIPFGAPAAVGAPVSLIANPSGNLFYYSTGIVNRNTANKALGKMGNRMEISADFAKGSSGGPVLDNKGNLVGMVAFTRSIYYQENPQQNLQMVLRACIPVGTLRSLFNKS